MFGAHAASIGEIESTRTHRPEHAHHRPVDDGEHDADADAVQRAATAGGDGEGHREQRHDHGDERKRDLALQLHHVGDDVETADPQLLDVALQLRVGHPLGVRFVGLEIRRRLERQLQRGIRV